MAAESVTLVMPEKESGRGVLGIVQGVQRVVRQSPYRLEDCLRSVEVAGDRGVRRWVGE
jgi:adenosine/AMP kinase